MSLCEHSPTGMVSCSPGEDNYAQTPVCADPECIAEASKWVHRLTGKVPLYVLTVGTPLAVNREGKL